MEGFYWLDQENGLERFWWEKKSYIQLLTHIAERAELRQGYTKCMWGKRAVAAVFSKLSFCKKLMSDFSRPMSSIFYVSIK